MAYLTTNSVSVFPTTYRTKIMNGKYTSEENFVNILNSITDINSYVISFEDGVLKMVIHGYYFEVLINKTSNMSFGIVVESGDSKSNALVRYDNMAATDLDENNNFMGLYYSTSGVPSKDVGSNSLYTLKVTDNDGNVINKLKFSADSVQYNDSMTISQAVDTKQDNLSTGDGIEIRENRISVKPENFRQLTSLRSKGSNPAGQKIVYFNSSGEAVESQSNVGTNWNGEYAQNTYLKGGVITGGQKIYASTESPNNSVGEIGDIWFKYTTNG